MSTCRGAYEDLCKNAATHFGDKSGVIVDQSFLKSNAATRQRRQTYVIATQFGGYLGLLTIGFRSSSLPKSSVQKTKMAWRISIGRATAALLVFDEMVGLWSALK